MVSSYNTVVQAVKSIKVNLTQVQHLILRPVR